MIEKNVHGDGPFAFGPGELFGFNTGNLMQDDTESLKSILAILQVTQCHIVHSLLRLMLKSFCE